VWKLFDARHGVKKLFNFVPVINCPTSANEPSNAEVGQVIASIGFASFLKLIDMASKSCRTLYPQSIAQLRQTSLQMKIFLSKFCDESRLPVVLVFLMSNMASRNDAKNSRAFSEF